jgi:uncharacterized protein YaaR (DUF327 family)
MAKIDFPADPQEFFAGTSSYLNPNTPSRIKGRRSKKPAGTGRAGFDSILKRAAEAELEAQEALPVSAETVNRLMEDVRTAGDALSERPFPQEILSYKRAVRNFMHYVVDNGFQVEDHPGIPNYLRSGFKGGRGGPNAQERKLYHAVQVVDCRLEDLAAALMKGQVSQLELLSRLEEIKGLLVDLMF